MAFLAGGLGTVPLATIADHPGRPVEEVVRVVADRLHEAPPDLEQSLQVATTILLGLRYPVDRVNFLMKGIFDMEESSVIQDALSRGEAKGLTRGRTEALTLGRTEGHTLSRTEGALVQARRTVIDLGQRRLGPASPADRAILDRLDDLDRLEE